MYKMNGVLPNALITRPKADVEVRWYLQSFHMLSTSRSLGMKISGIPLSEIISYINVFGSFNDLECDVEVIQAIDRVYLQHVNS